MKISDLMHEPAVTCHRLDPLTRAAQLMWEYDCGALPVVDDRQRVVGMITDRDICMAGYLQGRRLCDLIVESAMATEVVVREPDDLVEEVEELMAARRIRRVPVVDRKMRPIGMVSISDITRHAATAPKRDGLDRRVIETLAAIFQPRDAKPAATRKRKRTRRAGSTPARAGNRPGDGRARP